MLILLTVGLLTIRYGSMKRFLLFFVCLFLSISIFAAPGFSKGDRFQVVTLRGNLSVQCNLGSEVRQSNFQCETQVLNPASYDIFVGSAIPAADKLVLTAQREDKSLREKEESYDGSRGQSQRAINLWASSVFERPLLNYGVNIVTYKLIKDKTVHEQGVFKVQVESGSGRSCPTHSMSSGSAVDCESSFSICDRYFRAFNYCQ